MPEGLIESLVVAVVLLFVIGKCRSVLRGFSGNVRHAAPEAPEAPEAPAPIQNIDENEFEQRLKETIAWCSRTPKVSQSAQYLRTPALKPSIFDDSSLFWAGAGQAALAIEGIAQKRKQLLLDEALITQSNSGLAGGRLLVYFLGASNHNGATATISNYFDDEDNPPWDTWICCISGKELKTTAEESMDFRIVLSQSAYTTDYVVSWVPPEWVDEVSEAMRVEVTGTIMWADILVSRPEKHILIDLRRACIPFWLERYASQ